MYESLQEPIDKLKEKQELIITRYLNGRMAYADVNRSINIQTFKKSEKSQNKKLKSAISYITQKPFKYESVKILRIINRMCQKSVNEIDVSKE